MPDFVWTAPPVFRYPPPVLKTADSGASWYETHNGRKAVRASKVVNEPFDPKAWFDMCGGQSDGAIVSSIINGLGTLTHARIERYLRNQRAPKWNLQPVNAYFGGIMPLLENINNITCCEQPLYSEKLNIAGTTDCVADYDGVRSIIDFKTSTKPKDKNDKSVQAYFLQATLYSRMWEEMTGEKINNFAILMTVNGGQYKSFTERVTNYDNKLDQVLRDGGYLV